VKGAKRLELLSRRAKGVGVKERMNGPGPKGRARRWREQF
jgi:hypothetical protein